MEEDSTTDSASAKDFAAANMEEDPGTKWDDEDAKKKAHPAPNFCRLTEDHLVLIFEMCDLRDAQGYGRETTQPTHAQQALRRLVRLPIKRACETSMLDLLLTFRLPTLPR
jgi:hypothetical protein